jgi:hypothetical protein
MVMKKRDNISMLLYILVTTKIMIVNQQSIRQKSTPIYIDIHCVRQNSTKKKISRPDLAKFTLNSKGWKRRPGSLAAWEVGTAKGHNR